MTRAGRIWTLGERDGQWSATQKLQAAVQALTRARRLQILVEYFWGGLFWGLMTCCVAVVCIRFGVLPYAISTVVASLMGVALITAIISAWWRRPDALQVAILADLQLHLKQKLSTAWEFAQSESHPALTESLAAQAIRARLPARPELVFPVRINLWGRLTPLAVVLLMLLGIVEWHRIPQPTNERATEQVITQGLQLRDYARRMEARAQQNHLTRSSAQAQVMQRLGNRMASGALLPEQALNRLRQLDASLAQQRQSALSEGQLEALAVPSITDTRRVHTELADLATGQAQRSELQFDEQTLSQLGIQPETLERAWANFQTGDEQKLRQILKQLANIEQALHDAEELAKAQKKLQRLRENLGDSVALDSGTPSAGPNEALSANNTDDFSDSGRAPDSQDGLSDRGRGSGYGRQDAHQGTQQQQASPLAPPSESLSVMLNQPSTPGEMFSAPARVLPRVNRPTVTTIELDASFATKMEEALAKEDYPLHQKELIRRYFLTLSEGAPAEDTAAERP